MKIKNLDISGIRGIKKSINISFGDSRSLLLYGDNGSGKSSITDGYEWFLYNKIEHLSSGEIGKTWVEALRNIFLNDDQDAYVDIKFSIKERKLLMSIPIKVMISKNIVLFRGMKDSY